jgi:hypothetical protein
MSTRARMLGSQRTHTARVQVNQMLDELTSLRAHVEVMRKKMALSKDIESLNLGTAQCPATATSCADGCGRALWCAHAGVGQGRAGGSVRAAVSRCNTSRGTSAACSATCHVQQIAAGSMRQTTTCNVQATLST